MAGERSNHRKRSSSRSDYDDDRRKSKRRNISDDRGKVSVNSEDTVYRYLCPSKKTGSIMGKGGEIIKQLRSETNSKIRINESVSGCDERVITLYSKSDETNDFEGGDRICPAQHALIKVHDRVAAELAADEDSKETPQVKARLLVPADQMGGVIGKGGHTVQGIRNDTGAQIRIFKDNYLPTCALSCDELLQITGEASQVRKALIQVASRLHAHPSRSEHLLYSATANIHSSGGSIMGTRTSAPIMGLRQLVGTYGGYNNNSKGENGDWGHTHYPPSRRESSSSKEFSLRLLCPAASLGTVIGKGGAIINQVRQESGATINVDSPPPNAEDCVIVVAAKEIFEDTFSPTIEAAVRLQPRCSDRIERESGRVLFTTRLLVRNTIVGCLIGKGGSIVSEIRRITKASIRVLSHEDLPKVAERDDEMVEISAELDLVKDALIEVGWRLRANFFEREAAAVSFVPVVPYLPVAPEVRHYEDRDSRSHRRGHSYDRYDTSRDRPRNDEYRRYDTLQGRRSSDAYRPHDSYSSRHGGSSGYSRRSPPPARRSPPPARRSPPPARRSPPPSRRSPPSRRRDYRY